MHGFGLLHKCMARYMMNPGALHVHGYGLLAPQVHGSAYACACAGCMCRLQLQVYVATCMCMRMCRFMCIIACAYACMHGRACRVRAHSPPASLTPRASRITLWESSEKNDRPEPLAGPQPPGLPGWGAGYALVGPTGSCQS